MAYASYAKTSKSGGLNMSGLPLTAANQPALATAVIKPEQNTTYEIGLKSRLFANRLQVNADLFNTTVHDFQTNVVDSGPGALRGYLANIALVRSKGAEMDAQWLVTEALGLHASASLTDGRYVSYRNGPCPLEQISAATTVCDLSGRPITGLPSSVWSFGGEYHHPVEALGQTGEAFAHAESTLRTHMYGDPTDSRYTRLSGYGLVNASLGYRSQRGWEISLWARNLTDAHYLQNVTVQSGNSGLIVGTPGDPRTVGMTLRTRF